jgi:hypothetical protein
MYWERELFGRHLWRDVLQGSQLRAPSDDCQARGIEQTVGSPDWTSQHPGAALQFELQQILEDIEQQQHASSDSGSQMQQVAQHAAQTTCQATIACIQDKCDIATLSHGTDASSVQNQSSLLSRGESADDDCWEGPEYKDTAATAGEPALITAASSYTQASLQQTGEDADCFHVNDSFKGKECTKEVFHASKNAVEGAREGKGTYEEIQRLREDLQKKDEQLDIALGQLWDALEEVEALKQHVGALCALLSVAFNTDTHVHTQSHHLQHLVLCDQNFLSRQAVESSTYRISCTCTLHTSN